MDRKRADKDYIFNESGELGITAKSVGEVALQQTHGNRAKAIELVKKSVTPGEFLNEIIKFIKS